MKLFKYEGYKVTVEPEVLTLKVFKKLWNRDKSPDKTKAMNELSFIYFFCDPRSDFMNILDESERAFQIKEQEGIKDSWEPDKAVLEAMELYKTLTTSVAAGLLGDAKFAVLKIREALRNISFDGIELDKKPKAIKDTTAVLMEIPKVIKSLGEAERAMNSEILENSRMRGQGEKTVMEDNLLD